MRYAIEDCGLYIVGALGIKHAMLNLASLVEPFADRELLEQLRSGQPSDNHWEFDEATDLLQEYTIDGLIWNWYAGDLVLQPVENWEPGREG